MKDSGFIDINFTDIKTLKPLKRRSFLKLLGSGIIVLFSLDSSAFQEAIKKRGFLEITAYDLTSFLRIGEDGRVTCLTGKIEMGQGAITSLSQIISEELEIPISSVDMIMGDTDVCPWDLGTFGSMTMRFFGVELKNAAAEARAVLIQLASEELKVPKEKLSIRNGEIFNREKSEQKITYGALAKKKKIEKRLDLKSDAKKPSDFSVIGKDVKRVDASVKVTGKAKYAGDIHFPDMLYAKILRPPAHNATIKSADMSALKEIGDILLIEEGGLTAVLHKYPDVAERALAKIQAEYEIPPSNLNEKNISEHLLTFSLKGKTNGKGGNLQEGRKKSSKIVEKTYSNGYIAHAPIETHTAVAKWEGDKITVWASTQTPFLLQSEISRELKIPLSKVRILTPFVGGGFGGKTENRQAVDAAILARAAKKPVQVMRSRREEFFFDIFMPASVVKIKSGMDGNGKIVYWDYNVYFAGERGGEHFYDIAHHSTVTYGGGMKPIPGTHPFATGPWRAPANNTNTFARESQIDIMAEKTGIDPFEFRLKNLKNERMKKALKEAATVFGWKERKKSESAGFGVSCSLDADTCVAAIAEVEVDRATGNIHVKRIVCAQDMGLIVNPEGAKMQVEGCLTMGLGYALSEEIHFTGGEITEENFDTYQIPRFSQVPHIETILIDNKNSLPYGGGEPAITCMGGLIANAVYDAVGVRLFSFPLTPEKIMAKLETA